MIMLTAQQCSLYKQMLKQLFIQSSSQQEFFPPVSRSRKYVSVWQRAMRFSVSHTVLSLNTTVMHRWVIILFFSFFFKLSLRLILHIKNAWVYANMRTGQYAHTCRRSMLLHFVLGSRIPFLCKYKDNTAMLMTRLCSDPL